MLKTRPATPLETIYEESGSFASSVVDNQHRANHHHHHHHHHQSSYNKTNETINGLISARSIPSVDMERNRANSSQQKLPIEVRYRDGSKRYIHPTLTQTIIQNRRKATHSSSSSSHDPSSSKKQLSNVKYRQVVNSTSKEKKSQSKLPLVLTFITSEELNQAGIISTDESEQSTLTRSQSNSSVDTVKPANNKRKISFERLTTTIPANYRQPADPQQQNTTNRSQSLTSSQAVNPSSNQQSSINSIQSSAITTSPNRPASSLHIALTNDENERNLSYQHNLSNLMSSSKDNNGTVKQAIQTDTTVFVGGGSHSAFRPFFKPFHSQAHTFTPRVPLTTNRRPFGSIQQQQQQQQIVPYSYQQYGQMLPSNLTHSSMNTNNYNPNFNNSMVQNHGYNSMVQNHGYNSMVQNHGYNSMVQNHGYNSMISNEFLSDPLMNPSSHIKSLKSMNTSSTNNNVDRSFILSNALSVSSPVGQNSALGIDLNTKWYNVTSNSINDVPHLSTRYSRIPLRITIPVLTPTHNRKLVFRHDMALENRLLNAGLSPETIALYERVLDIAENRQMALLSPPKLIDQYQF